MSKQELFDLRSNGRRGIKGAVGPIGPTGATGPAGVGVAAGGNAGQVLAKISNADYATEWIDVVANGFANIDGGAPDTIYGGLVAIDGGTV